MAPNAAVRAVAALGTLALVLATALATPASALMPARQAHGLGAAAAPAAAAARVATRSTPLFSGGWQEQYNAEDVLTSDLHFDHMGLVAGLGPAVIVFAGVSTGGTQIINKFVAPFRQTLQAGHTYTSAEGASVGAANCIGAFEVDQLVLSGRTTVSAAVQYAMYCPGASYLGALATNLPNVPGVGYYLYDNAGALYGLGNNAYLCYLGDLSSTPLNAPVVGMATTPDGAGYWMVAGDGGVFGYGDAAYYGSTGGLHLQAPIVGMATTPDGRGYWLVAADGGIFAFGDARYLGSTGAIHLKSPMVGMATTASGNGYWLVAADGGIFAFGDARYLGSTGAIHLKSPMVGMATTASGNGYWLVASDGGIFAFGDARYLGSTGYLTLAQPIVGMATTPDGAGYWLVGGDGGVFAFGDAAYHGGLGGIGTGFVGIART